ncbi:MAG: mechanosensitive ion channel [Bacteroidales bacterium]
METIETAQRTLKNYLDYTLFTLGDSAITLWLVLYLIFGILLLFYLSSQLKKLLVNRILLRYSPEIGVRQAIAAIVRYIITFLGLLILFQTAGIDLSTLTVLAGALGIGIGLGLQSITNNFVSGIIILFERPIKVGDRVEVGPTHGRVIRISGRATTILTNDNVSIIVPNSDFMNTPVINWSHNDSSVRFRIPVSVSYSSNVEKVIRLLLQVGKESAHVLQNPPPDYRLLGFGDNGIHFELLVWTNTYTHRRGKFVSNINVSIIKKFHEHNIEIPFPQRDLHLKSGFNQQPET